MPDGFRAYNINFPIYEWISVGYPCLRRCHRGDRSTSVGPRQSAAVQKRHWQLTRKISLQMWHGRANTQLSHWTFKWGTIHELSTTGKVSICYMYIYYIPYSYILYKRMYIYTPSGTIHPFTLQILRISGLCIKLRAR